MLSNAATTTLHLTRQSHQQYQRSHVSLEHRRPVAQQPLRFRQKGTQRLHPEREPKSFRAREYVASPRRMSRASISQTTRTNAFPGQASTLSLPCASASASRLRPAAAPSTATRTPAWPTASTGSSTPTTWSSRILTRCARGNELLLHALGESHIATAVGFDGRSSPLDVDIYKSLYDRRAGMRHSVKLDSK